MTTLSFATDYPHDSDNFILRLDPRAKLITLISLSFFIVSLPLGASVSFALYAAYIFTLLLLSPIPIKRFLFRTLVVIPFAAAILLMAPFAEGGMVDGLSIASHAVIKAYLSASSLLLLVSITPFEKLIEAGRWLRIPKTLLQIIAMAWRYIFILVEEASTLKRAADSRGYGGRWLFQAKTVGNLIASLFLRNYERAERVHMAMMARGYDGAIHDHSAKDHFNMLDILFLSISFSLFVFARWIAI